MTKEQIKAEIAELEQQAKQMIANANFISGALQAFQKLLASLEESDKESK